MILRNRLMIFAFVLLASGLQLTVLSGCGESGPAAEDIKPNGEVKYIPPTNRKPGELSDVEQSLQQDEAAAAKAQK